MFQRNFDIINESELIGAISILKDSHVFVDKNRIFLQIFFSRFSTENAKKIIDYIHSELPEVKVVGMSLHGDAMAKLNEARLIRMNICDFSESDVTVFAYDAQKQKEQKIYEELRTELEAIKDLRGVLVIATGLSFNISQFMERVTKGFENIPFFGTQASMNTSDSEMLRPFIVADDVIQTGVVIAAFSGKNLHFHTKAIYGWKPIGMPLSVELGKPEGIGDTLVSKIDGKPATEIYKKYLNVNPDINFVSNICEFPLVVERNGNLMARVPCAYNAKGELFMMGSIKPNETVRFTYGKTDTILSESWEASCEMSMFYPQAIFLYICANRAIFMKERAHEEIDYFLKIVPGTVYCHGFSELYAHQGMGGVYNSTLITVGIREGEPLFDIPSIANLPAGLFDNDKVEKTAAVRKSSEISNTHSMFGIPLGVSIPIADRLVTFLEAVTDELRSATQAANAASEAKSAFLSNMSHEIRSPINAVLGLDEMILRESTEPQIRGYARDIQSSGKSLLSIINDILDFSKIEAGKMEIINDDYDLRSVITDLANMIEQRAVNKGLDFIVNVDTKMPHLLYGDETRIKQCALNILTNAVKYTHEGSVTLTVGFKKTDEGHIDLTISVKDTGIGIKEEDLEKLYKPFERIEESRNRSIEGTGLGMSIVNGLLSEMNTNLSVKSVYGKGSDFSFTIEQKVRDWERIGTREDARKALLEGTGTYTESFQAPKAKILVVDDTPINLTVVRGLLKNTRIQIDTAGSGAEALEHVRETQYDIMFIDHLMPKMDGIEFLVENFADSKSINKNTPAIALTANAVSGAKDLYLNAGFDDYLSKPIEPKKLEEMIAHYLPKELLILPGDKDFVATKPNKWDGVERRENVCEVSELFADLFGVDIEAALKNCGGKAVFMDAVANFYDSIDEKSKQIEEFCKADDWKNYTVLVHALKSSARLIGAGKLSDFAKELEALGNKAQDSAANSIQQIKEKTPLLLSDYRAYLTTLAPLCKAETPAKKKTVLPAISKEKLSEAFLAIKEVVSSFDFDTADSIIQELSGYAMETSDAELFEKVKKAVKDADAARVAEFLGELPYSAS